MDDSNPAEVLKPQRKNLLLVILLGVILLFPTVPLLLYRYGVTTKNNINKALEFEIKEGTGVIKVSEDLKDAGLIESPFLFNVYVKLHGAETNIQAGVYGVPPRSSIQDLVALFQDGRNDVTIRYLEGWRVEQLGLLLSEELGLDYTGFVTEAKDLEGYLFPDTYIFNRDILQEDIIEILRENFDDKNSQLLSIANLDNIGLTLEEAVTLASIIEREAVKQEDREKIAGILIKRYREGMPLDADATTQYAISLPRHCGLPEACLTDSICELKTSVEKCLLGKDSTDLDDIDWWPHDLTVAEIQYSNPYNTRRVLGFPPAPISSFGTAALEAVVNHVETPYYFYLTDDRGVTHYATTLDQHNLNIATYLR